MDEARRRNKNALVSYFELPGCGGKDHWTDISPELKAFRENVASLFMALPSPVVCMPRNGILTVTGYLKTRDFEVQLESIDQVAELHYDLDQDRFELDRPGEIKIVNNK